MPDFTDALGKARAELANLRRQRQQLDVKIRKMEHLVGALNTVDADDDDAVEMVGITDAIRAVLQKSRVVMTPTQIREELKAAGYDFVEKYGNSLIQAVHVVLKRLVQSDEVMEIAPGQFSDDKTYWWTMNGTPQRSLADFGKMSIGELMNYKPAVPEPTGRRSPALEGMIKKDKK